MIPGPGLSPLMMAMMALDNPDMLARRMAELGRMPPVKPITTPSMQPQVDQMLPQPMGPMIPPQAHGSTAQPNLDAMLPAMGDVPTVNSPVVNSPQAHGSTARPMDLSTLLPAMGDVPTVPGLPPVPAPSGPPPAGIGYTPAPPADPETLDGMRLSWPAPTPPMPTPQPVPMGVPPVMPGMEAPMAAPPAVATPPATVNPSQALAASLSPMPAPTQITPHPASNPVPAQAPASGPATAAAGGVPATPAMGDLMTAMAGVQASQAGGGSGRVSNAPAPFIQGALNPQTAEILRQVLANPNLVGSLASFQR